MDKANLRIEEQNLGYTRIVAPFDGTVMKVQVRQGQVVDATQGLPVVMQIANLSKMTVVAEVPEADITRLRKGQTAYITMPGSNNRRWYGELRRIEPTPQVRNGAVQYDALFDVQNDGRALLPRMTTRVYFVKAEAHDVLLVPLAALRQGQQLAGEPAGNERESTSAAGPGGAIPAMQRRNGTVLVRKADGSIEVRRVVVGVTDPVKGEVLEGLEEGEEVVVGKR